MLAAGGDVDYNSVDGGRVVTVGAHPRAVHVGCETIVFLLQLILLPLTNNIIHRKEMELDSYFLFFISSH